MRILVCGSRDLPAKMKQDVWKVLAGYEGATIVEGCARGADRWAEEAAENLGFEVEHHPADWNRYGKSAGFKRNTEMLDSNIDVVIAFWDGESKGTLNTIEGAEKRGIPVRRYR